MPTNLLILLSPPVFPDGYCPQSEQQRANDIASGIGAQLPGNYIVWNYGDTVPAVEDQDKPWMRTFPDGSPDRVYVFFDGAWVAPHPVPASGDERRIWVGTTDDLETYDGGEAGTVSDAEGPFWEVDHDFDGRIPIGAGTPEAWGAAITVGTNAGAGKVTMTLDHMVPHQHLIARSTQVNTSPALDGANVMAYRGGGLGNENYVLLGVEPAADNPANVGLTSSTGNGSASNQLPTLPPVRAVYMIKRTARLFYTPTS